MKKENFTQERIEDYLKSKKGILAKSHSVNIAKSLILTSLPIVGLANISHAQIKTDATINQTDTHNDVPAGLYAEKLFIQVDQGFSGGGQHSGFNLTNPGNAQIHARMNSASIWIAGTADVKFVGGGYPALLTQNASINATNVAGGYNTGSAGFPAQFFFTYNNQGCGGCNWQGAGEQVGYVGFSFKIGANTHYGFMEIGITPDDNNNGNGSKAFRLIGIGYEQTPNTPINTILPVEMTSFAAKSTHKSISLDWQTATETNNAGFELQRSTDGRNFQNLTFIEGNGNTPEAQDYFYEDKELRKGQLYYYRLKQIDFDGRFEYSEVVTASLISDETIAVFAPNPAKAGQTRLNYTTSNEGELLIQIFDVSGKEIMQQRQAVVEGTNQLDLDLSDLGTGIFFAKMEQNGKAVYQKLIIK